MDKQYALWSTAVNEGAYATDGAGLWNIAKHYKEFYETIHKLPRGYEDILEAWNYNKEDESISKDYLEQTRMELDGEEDLKTFVYKDTITMADPTSQSYVLGPFFIDYSVDDENKDVYYSCGQYEVKYNAIEEIKVYNQDKINIEELGGSFEIVYEYPSPEGPIKIQRISDQGYYANADMKKVDAFESRKPFYIVVHRGSMKAEQFKDFYAKVKFQYLYKASASMTRYQGDVYEYWYEEHYYPKVFPVTYSGTYYKLTRQSYTDSNGNTHYYWGHPHSSRNYAKTYNIDEYGYEMFREKNSEHAQAMLGFTNGSNWRDYRTKSIVITTKEPPVPEFQLMKVSEQDGKPLYGAEFDVDITITGENIYHQPISENMKMHVTTDSNGKAVIKSADLQGKATGAGVDVQKILNGKLTAVFTEVNPPIGYEANSGTLTCEINMGVVSGAEPGDVENSVRLTLSDKKIPNPPVIRVAKVQDTGNGAETIKECDFSIRFAWEDENGIRHDLEPNILHGTTKDGYLDISAEDLARLLDNNGNPFDITHFTGKLMMDIIEVKSADNFSIQSESINITLVFEDGNLIDYSENKDTEVLVNYLYDSTFEELAEFASGKKQKTDLSEHVQSLIDKWAAEQMALLEQKYEEARKEGKKFEEMTYDDVLEWLRDYIEKNPDDIKEEFRKSAYTTVNNDPNVIEIVMEDFPGTKFPEIPWEPTGTNDDTMTIGGTVFLDEYIAKGGLIRNGVIDTQDKRLYGIKVYLWDETTGGLATVVQPDADNPGADKDIRTNPTLTDKNGYYEFRGVDPLHKYKVEFEFNGVKYETTQSDEGGYNTEQWAKSSKVPAGIANSMYTEVNYAKKVYDYEEIEGLRKEGADWAWLQIINTKHCPSNDEIKGVLAGNHANDPEIQDKLIYLYDKCITKVKTTRSYPYFETGTFIINDDQVNEQNPLTAKFAKNQTNLIYPGQKQINMGLITREVIDLSLITDIVETTATMNNHETRYDFYDNKSSYTQYLYEEDYDYSVQEDNGMQHKKYNSNKGTDENYAYYSKLMEDEFNYYLTYEVQLTNATNVNAQVTEVVDYYNNNFTYNKNGYDIEKYGGKDNIHINGYEAFYDVKQGNKWIEQSNITSSISDVSSNSRYGLTDVNAKNMGETYGSGNTAYKFNELFVNFGGSPWINDQSRIRVRLTFKLGKDNVEAAKILYDYLYTDFNGEEGDKTDNKSKIWAIANYAEINGYKTNEGYLDRDSHPGTFVIKDFEDKMKEYQERFIAWIRAGGKSGTPEEQAMKLSLTRLNNILENDAWKEVMNLTNTGFKREIHGNVWEAVVEEGKLDEFLNSLDLQPEYGERYLKYLDGDKITAELKDKLDLEGIEVELVELLEDDDPEAIRTGSNQIVRATTKTNANGEYSFHKYISGKYTVRFIYGNKGANGEVLRSEVSTTTYEGEPKDYLPINGQYYQSTEANPYTDKDDQGNADKYWYKQNDYRYSKGQKEEQYVGFDSANEHLTRYSDAYDDAYTRLTQMLCKIEGNGTEANQNESDYDYQGVIEVQSARHTDPMYAYTSTIDAEIEYIRPETFGVQGDDAFLYSLSQIDLGLTPKAYTDFNIQKWVDNIKIYKEGASKDEPLIEANFDENGTVVGQIKISNEARDNDLFRNIPDDMNYKDGLISLGYNEELLQRATLEIKYKIKVSNDSEYDASRGIYDTIRYYYDENGKRRAVAYYDEEAEKLTAYETDEQRGPVIVYHNRENTDEYSASCLAGENRKEVDRLKKFQKLAFNAGGYKAKEIIQTGAKQIIDYAHFPLDFDYESYSGEAINGNWETVDDYKEFVSSREEYIMENGEIKRAPGAVTPENSVIGINLHTLKHKVGGPLYDILVPGDERTDNLTLKYQLQNVKSNIGEDEAIDLSGDDFEFSNIAELTRIANTAGRIIDIEGYDINGKDDKETSKVRKLEDVEDHDPFTPTLGTSKSQTINIVSKAGLNLIENVQSNLSIVLIVLVVFAGGLVLIKKFVIVPKNQ